MKGNAIIASTRLGYDNYGILTGWLILEQPGSGQGFGGWRLDSPKGVESNACTIWVKSILQTVGVSYWEDLKGKNIRVDGEDLGRIFGIGHITEDKWFYMERKQV